MANSAIFEKKMNVIKFLNNKLKSLLMQYGIVLIVLFLITSIVVAFEAYPNYGLELCSFFVALASVFLTIIIVYMNNYSQKMNTERQIAAFKSNTERQILSFQQQIDKIVNKLNQVCKVQRETSEDIIKDFKNQTDKIVQELNIVANQIAENRQETKKIPKAIEQNAPLQTKIVNKIPSILERADEARNNYLKDAIEKATNFWSKIKKRI